MKDFASADADVDALAVLHLAEADWGGPDQSAIGILGPHQFLA